MLIRRRSSLAHYVLLLTIVCGALLSIRVAAQSESSRQAENIAARREFQDMKFGMFIHWGVYSV